MLGDVGREERVEGGHAPRTRLAPRCAGVIGLIVPALTHIAPILAPLVTVGLAVTMLGAIVTHARRKEFRNIAVNIVLLVLALTVAWGWLGPYAFGGVFD